MPDVCDGEARDELERLAPVGARVAADRGVHVALFPLQVARLRGNEPVDASAVAPLHVERDAVWRISEKKEWLLLPEKASHVGGIRAVAAEEPMLAEKIQVARLRDRDDRRLGYIVGIRCARLALHARDELLDLGTSETSQVDRGRTQLLE